jgi:ComF family protein
MISRGEAGLGMLAPMQRLLDLLLPPSCGGCGREGTALCDACRSLLGRRLAEPAGVPLGLAHGQPGGLVQLEWCAAYSGPARACLHALKYDGEQRLAAPLGRLMAERWRRAGIGGDVLVPVPVHAARRRERGFDQADLLARAVGSELGLPVVPAVVRAARTKAQHALDRSARAANVGRVFSVPASRAAAVSGSWAVLIDDVMTTGATLTGCAGALRAAGARAVSALTLARER